jgi:hypothetical protein
LFQTEEKAAVISNASQSTDTGARVRDQERGNTRINQKVSFEYGADDQQISFNVRNGESSHFEASLIWPEFAHYSHLLISPEPPDSAKAVIRLSRNHCA